MEKESCLKIENKVNAYFTLLGAYLIAIFSLLLMFPISNWMISRYFIPRKFIDSRKLVYKGKLWVIFIIGYIGLSLVIGCIILIEFLLKRFGLFESIPYQLLNAIPGVLGSFFITIHVNKYNQKSTHFVDEEDKKSNFEFHIFLFLGKYVVTKVIQTFSLWILYPVSSRLSVLYDYKRGYIDGYFFTYKFTLKKIYPGFLLDLLLLVVTFGLYFPVLMLRRMTSDQVFVHIKSEEKEGC